MIEVHFRINFGKALRGLGENRLIQTLNKNLAPDTAEASKKYIKSGNVRPKLPKTNPRGTGAPPLFDTGKLSNSLKGGPSGITGISYAKDHRKDSGKTNKRGEIIAYPWKGLDVPQREYIVARDEGKLLIRGTGDQVKKIYKDFEKRFVKLLSKRIRK